jgi:hypothetical protein
MPFGVGLVNQCGRGRADGNPLPIAENRLARLAEGGHALDQTLGQDGEGRQIGLDLDPLSNGRPKARQSAARSSARRRAHAVEKLPFLR